jgi:cytochrome c-type biogenesis protein CcmH/NrfG
VNDLVARDNLLELPPSRSRNAARWLAVGIDFNSPLPAGYNQGMRFRLRTLLIVLAVLPPLLAGAWWGWREWQQRSAAASEAERLENQVFPYSFDLTR